MSCEELIGMTRPIVAGIALRVESFGLQNGARASNRNIDLIRKVVQFRFLRVVRE